MNAADRAALTALYGEVDALLDAPSGEYVPDLLAELAAAEQQRDQAADDARHFEALGKEFAADAQHNANLVDAVGALLDQALAALARIENGANSTEEERAVAAAARLNGGEHA